MIIANQRIRLAIDTSQMGAINDVLTGATPQFWNGVDLQFELGIFSGAILADISNFDSITVDLKASDPRTGLPLMSSTLASGSLNNALTLDAWAGGATADCHALAVFTNAETNLDLSDDTVTFWLVISALTSDSPPHKIVLGATPLNVTEGGEGVEPPASVVTPIYYTAAQSDARYTLAVDLTTINSDISTLISEMTAVTATANAALPKAGGTVTGAVTLTGISGVLKAPSNILAGSATTTDLPEGTNLYYTNGRFNAALGAVSGAASGVCPLDSSSLIPAAFLPAITVHNTFVVSSQAAMLALSANKGDVAVRTDLTESFILTAAPATTLGNWTQLLTPASAVTTVNGLSGTVVLTTTQVSEGTNLYYTTARAIVDAIAALLTGFSSATGGNVTASDSVLIALGRLENRCALNDAKSDGSNRVLKAGDTMTGPLQFSGTTNAGVILSSLTDTQRAALTPSAGMIIYNSTLSAIEIYNGTWQTLSIGGGSTLFSGSGAPASTLGANGNYYLDTATGNIYLKASGSWSIIYSPTGGSGAGASIANATLNPISGTGSPVTLFTPGTTGMYRVSIQTSTSGTSGTLEVDISFTTRGKTFSYPCSVAHGSGVQVQSQIIASVADATTAITYQVISVTTGGTDEAYISLEKLF